MKKMYFEGAYEAPEVLLATVAVEKGFAQSGLEDGDAPGIPGLDA